MRLPTSNEKIKLTKKGTKPLQRFLTTIKWSKKTKTKNPDKYSKTKSQIIKNAISKKMLI